MRPGLTAGALGPCIVFNGIGEREKERALGLPLCHNPGSGLDIEVDLQRGRFGRCEADFALE